LLGINYWEIESRLFR